MPLISFFNKRSPAHTYVSPQSATYRHEATEGSTLQLARLYRTRRPTEFEIKSCQKAIGWELLDEDGRYHAQRWLLGLVASCGNDRTTYDYARHLRADFAVQPETEQRHRRLRAQAEDAPRLRAELAEERHQVQELGTRLRAVEEDRAREAHDRDVLVGEREEERRRSAVYYDRLHQIWEQTAPVLALAPSNVRQGRVGRTGGAARHSLPPGFSNWAEVIGEAESQQAGGPAGDQVDTASH